MHCMQLLNCQAGNLCGSTYITLADISVYHIDRHVYLAQYFQLLNWQVEHSCGSTYHWQVFSFTLVGMFTLYCYFSVAKLANMAFMQFQITQ